MLCQKCEQAGIKTVLLSPEMALTPDDPGFVHFVPEANAIISTGNYEMRVTLPPASKVLGGTTLAVPPLDAAQELALSLRYLYAATSQIGRCTVLTRTGISKTILAPNNSLWAFQRPSPAATIRALHQWRPRHGRFRPATILQSCSSPGLQFNFNLLDIVVAAECYV